MSRPRMAVLSGAGAGPFAYASFRWLWCSSLASAGAQWMERVATGWLALETGGGPLAVGVVFAARMMPSLLFGLAAGTIADRADRRRQLVAVAAGAVGLMLLLGWLVGAGEIVFWQVAAISFLAGCLPVFDVPARQALIFDTVGREQVPSAVALNAVAARLFGAIGALAGGAVIPLVGVANSYLAVAAVYAMSLALVAAVRVPSASGLVGAARPPFRRALTDAARLIVDLPAVRTLLIAGVTCEVFAFSFMSAVPVVARDVYQAGAEGLGELNAATAVGATLAVVLLSGLPGGVRREPLLASVYLLYGASIIIFATTTSLPLALAVMVVIGACAGAFDALEQTLIQLAVPEDRRGRAVGVWVLGLGSAPIGHLEMGALAATTGAPTALFVNGLLVVAGAVTLFARAPTYRLGRQAV